MTVTAKALYSGGQLTNAAASVYASPSFTTSVITGASFANVDTNPHTLTVYVVRASGSASAANTLISARAIAAGVTDLAPELVGVTLGPGDAIYAKADAGTVVTCAGINGFQVWQNAV